MRRALVVGIDYYSHSPELYGCVNDAHAVAAALQRNADGTINFDCRLLTGTSQTQTVSRAELKDAIEQLFTSGPEIALLYFAGHGHIEATGGYVLASDARRGDEGMPLTEILTLANKSDAPNKIIILDSCHSGIAGDLPTEEHVSMLKEGLSVLTASTSEQYASEEDGSGVFTSLLVDALQGGAATLTGDVTPGGLYAYVDQSLGSWEQRPVFKTNVRQFVSLRKVQPPIELEDLQRIKDFFPPGQSEYELDPSYEPELKGRDPGMPPPDPENTAKFRILQRYNRVNLVVPVGVPNMWNAAMESRSCRLTVLGEHYRRLAVKNRL